MSVKNSAADEIAQRYQTWMQAIRARDLETILDLYADDATYMPPGKPKFSGKAALREVWASYLQREDFIATYTPTIHVSESGDMAYDVGHYQLSMKKDGQQTSFEGKYVVVWKRIDQQWKAVVDIDNSNTPSA
jgi:uncharacterized protein (TIGR02246 family)